jgi:hypothetical protein
MTEEVAAALRKWFEDSRKVESKFLQTMSDNPLEALMLFLIGGSIVFYNAERYSNPKIKTFWDAFYFVATCASVGYADVYAQTKVGKMVSAALNTFGPALTGKIMNPAAVAASASQNQAVLDKLDAILQELRLQRASSSA